MLRPTNDLTLQTMMLLLSAHLAATSSPLIRAGKILICADYDCHKLHFASSFLWYSTEYDQFLCPFG